MKRSDFRPKNNDCKITDKDREIITRKNIRNYLGMNDLASKELHIKEHPQYNEIYIDKSLKGRKLRQVIAHEEKERELMSQGMKYKQAHKLATRYEKRIK